MSGLLRNLIAFFIGLCGYASRATTDTVETRFWVTPFDSGVRVLKSGKYLQYAETARLDYLLKVGRFFAVLRGGAGFVNLAQQVRFLPIALFSRVSVETRLLYADDRCAYFQHALHARGNLAAEVLVKMKFKKAGRTVAPAAFLAFSFDATPDSVRSWEAVLQE